MKKVLILNFIAIVFTACGASSQTDSTNISTTRNTNNSSVVSSHSTENSAVPNATIVPKSETRKKWSQNGKPIDVSKFDAEIAKAEKDLKTKPKDETVKRALATAYVNRGLALTDARQYASALGDYRKAQKFDPNNEDAKTWIEQIISIYNSMNTESPKEGEEPPPLPFKKDAADANKNASL